MKRKRHIHLHVLLPLLLLAGSTQAQIATPPRYPGGDMSYASFLMNNLVYPETDSAIAGHVYVYITIDTDGHILNPRIEKSLGEAFDNEALRLVSLMPPWEPARDSEGRPVAVSSSIPITFFAPKPKSEKKPRYNEDGERILYIDTGPQFPGGEMALKQFIDNTLKKPYNAELRCESVFVMFIVNPNGKISDVRIPPQLDEECEMAIRSLMNAMPQWIAGTHHGNPVRMGTGINITF